MDKHDIGREIQRLIANARPAPAVVRRYWLWPIALAGFVAGAAWGYGIKDALLRAYGEIVTGDASPAARHVVGYPIVGGPACLARPGKADWPDIEVVYKPGV